MNERIHTQAKNEVKSPSFTPSRTGLLQRKCACGGTLGLDGDCAECRRKQLTLQRRPFDQADPAAAPPIVHDVLNSPGQPLELHANTEDGKGDSATTSIPRVGHDFSQIPVFAQHKDTSPAAAQNKFKTWGSAGGLSGLTLDVTFSVSDTPAASLQAIQTFMGTRRIDGLQVGTYSWQWKGKTWDAFVDGGINSPYVTLGGNSPAHPTQPYYLTPAEVSSQVSFSKDAGTIRVYDAPGAVALHEEAHFETAIVAVDFKGTKKDKILKVFKWGWLSKGTKPTVSKGTEIAGAPSGISVSSSVSSEFKNIVKHDYPKYDFS